MNSTDDPDLRALIDLSDHLSGALQAIGDHELTLATPCPDWNLAALIDHVTGGNWFTRQILDDQTTDEAMTATIGLFDGGSVSPARAATSVTEQLAAFTQPGVLDRQWHHVAGDLTGRRILRLRLHDLIIHTWDIQQTTGPPALIPTDLISWGLAELSDEGSITPAQFGVEVIPNSGTNADPEVAYLGCFGRSF